MTDEGGGDLLVALLSKTDCSVSMICKSGNRAAREMLRFIFMLIKPRPNTSNCVHRRIVIVKNCIIVRKQELGSVIKIVKSNVNVVNGSNSTIKRN
jgi:hypothetical protein